MLNDLDADGQSDGQIAEALRQTRSLEQTDTVVLVADLRGFPEEVVYVLDVANSSYRSGGHSTPSPTATSAGCTSGSAGVMGRRAAAALPEMRQLRVDVAKLADEVTNITKFIGDWYLARVYLGARERFHLDTWRSSVEQLLAQLDRLYGVVQSEVNERRILWLEALIVVLILVELLVALASRS